MIWRGVQVFFGILNAAILAFFLYWLAHNGWRSPDSTGIEYKDLVAILLTALGVMIAVLTLFLAVAAIWGYAQLKEEAKRKAKEKARQKATEVATRVAEKVAREVAEKAAVFPARRAAEEFVSADAGEMDEGEDYGKAAGGDDGARDGK